MMIIIPISPRVGARCLHVQMILSYFRFSGPDELSKSFRPGWTPRFILSLQGQRHLNDFMVLCAIETYLYLFVCGFMYWCKCISFHGATKAQLETQLTGAVLLLLWRFANTWGRGCGMRSWEPLCLPPILCLLLLLLLKSIDVQFHSMVNSKMYKCKQRTKPKDKWHSAACGKLSSLVLSSPRPSLVGPPWSFVGLLYCYCCCYCYWWAHSGHLWARFSFAKIVSSISPMDKYWH